MADEKAVKPQPATEKSGSRPLTVGDLVQASVAPDGTLTIQEALATLKMVDVADVDLLLTFAGGDHVIILNGALEALGANPPDAVFTDRKINLADLFKMVGVANPAKAGSLRLVTEHVDANPPPEVPPPETERVPETPPPAPMVKVGVGTSTGSGKGPGNGVGAGEGEGEVPITVTPITTPSPAVFTAGKRSSAVDAGLTDRIGALDVQAHLYGKSEFKVTPSGRLDLPFSAYDPALTASDNRTLHGTAAAQATLEPIHGTAGNDTLNFNAAFSTGEHQWVRALHVQISGFSSLDQIEIAFVAGKISLIPGFDLVGPGVTRGTAYALGGVLFQPWYITPTATTLTDGLDIDIVYNVTSSPVPVDFRADLIVTGGADPIASFTKITNLDFTWRDVVTETDFNVTTSTGVPMQVLPSAGVGVEIFAGDGDDVVYAGSGPDLVHGGNGADTLYGGRGDDLLDGGVGADILNGGLGSDTATYENAAIAVTATLDTTLGVINTGEASGDTYVGIENLKGSAYADILIGDMDPNSLTGGNGDDMLIGGGDADTLDGGAGNDTASYHYATGDVTVSLTSNAGTQGEAAGDVLASIENLIGGSGNDTFTGAAGVQANAFDGGLGSDTVSYAPSAAGVVATLTTGLAGVVQANDAAGDTFASIENLTGSFYDDVLIGNGDANVLSGGRGSNVLEGLGGADIFVGGIDTDTVSYAHSANGVVSSLTTVFGAGPAVVQTNDASGDTYASIENMIGTDDAVVGDTLIGNAGNNVIAGGQGNDILEGMDGSDTLDGGDGSDTATYVHATGYVRASLTSGLSGFVSQGDAQGDAFVSIEHLTGSDFDDTLIGDANANTLTGGLGNDILEGMGGTDTLVGGGGNNTASYEHAADAGGGIGVTASLLDASTNAGDALGDTYSNIQNLVGSAFDDILTGDAGNNVLTGGAGNDVLTGGTGTDNLAGGEGNDQLSDDLLGVAQMTGGNGDDVLSFTNYDGSVDTLDAGAGTDTLVAAGAGSLYWNFDMGPGPVQSGGTIRQNWGSVFANFSNVENITVAGSNYLYVYVSNGDNVITGGSTGSDYVDYRHALAGINANLATGIVAGGSGSDTLVGIEHLYYGSHYNDVLVGNAASNNLQGGQGADMIDGAGGTDMARYDSFNSGSVTVSLMDVATNASLGIVFTDTAAGDTLVSIEQLIGSGYNDILYGNSGANYLHGNGGDDILEGMAGADSLEGSGGNDTASYAKAGLAEAGGETSAVGQGVTANLTTTAFVNGPAVINAGDAAGDTYSSIENLLGSGFNDVLVGTTGANVIDGGAGDDILEGLAGADVLRGGTGTDTVTFAHSNATITVDLANSGLIGLTNDAFGDQYFGIENITGSNFHDFLYGDSVNNVLDGGLGNDLLDGGGGIDTASYASAIGAVTIDLGAGTVTGAAGTDTLVSIERVIGSNAADTVTGTAGDDVIDGGGGADIINGAGGSDTISYASATGPKSVILGGANSDGDTLTSIENMIGSAYGDLLFGDAADNVIDGGPGNDALDGGLHGASGDTLSYATATAAVTASLATGTASGGGGSDAFINFENLTGSGYDDTLAGNGSANRLDGGVGTDTVTYAAAASAVAVTINGTGTLGDAAGDVLSNIENLVGSAFSDTLTGSNQANLIDGGLGNDTMDGGAGTDTVTYAAAAAAVSVNLSVLGVNATGGMGSDSLINFENIVGSAFNDTLTGDGGSNAIEGGAGADSMNGGSGVASDTATYITSSAGVNVSLVTGATNTGGHAAGDVLTDFENLTGSAFNDTLTGNGSANVLDGGAGDDMLTGGSGGDQLIGGAGSDTAAYATAGSAVTASLTTGTGSLGDANGDTFSGIEHLTGSAYNDTLTGDASANILTGGAGNDTLSGGDGNDVIDATSGFDSVFGGSGNDTILVSVSAVNAASQYRGEGNTTLLNGGGDTLKLSGLVAGGYTLTALANETDNMEILDIRDGVNTALSLASLDVRNFVDGGSGSQMWIKANAGDTLNWNLVSGETVQSYSVTGGVDYLVFNASNTQVAQVHWQTA